jgi:predicted dienelactone hydrolase
VSPSDGEIVLSPSAVVSVAFAPPIAADERIEATLLRGVDDAQESASIRPLAADLASDGASATIEVDDLAPGRNLVSVKRLPVGATRASAFDSVTIDRGGYFALDAAPFAAGATGRSVTRPSTLDPAVPRPLGISIWYPTAPSIPPNPQAAPVVDAPLFPGAQALPVVLFSHGLCSFPTQSVFLALALARAGYIVAAMTHPGGSYLDPPAGQACVTTTATSFAERPGDVIATVDALLAWSADPNDARFYGAVDPGRIGMSGHSFGGQTALRMAPLEPRIRATLALAPALNVIAAVLTPASTGVPTMIQGGTLDTFAPFLTSQVPAYDALTAPRFLLEIHNTGHFAFADFCTPFFGLGGPDCAASALTQAQAHAIVLPYSLGFLGRYLAGDRRWDQLLEAQDGVLLQQER